MKKKMEFSKKLLVWLFIWANLILSISVFFVLYHNDSQTLQVLISVVGVEVVAGIIWYMKKSQAENEIKIALGPEEDITDEHLYS